MKKFIKRVMLSLAVTFSFSLALVPSVAHGQSKADICEGIGLTSGGSGDCSDPAGSPSVNSTIETVVNLLSLVVGIIAVIMVIIGGLKYILSSGDSNQINSAKNTILFALVGLAIVALAQVLVRFVIKRVTTPPAANKNLGLVIRHLS